MLNLSKHGLSSQPPIDKLEVARAREAGVTGVGRGQGSWPRNGQCRLGVNQAPVAKKSLIPAGTTKRVVIAGKEILLCNVEGAIYAIEDVCTHDGGELDQGDLEGCRIRCPRHGALFDVTTGAALTLPAIVPVPTYEVRIEDDDIFVRT